VANLRQGEEGEKGEKILGGKKRKNRRKSFEKKDYQLSSCEKKPL